MDNYNKFSWQYEFNLDMSIQYHTKISHNN